MPLNGTQQPRFLIKYVDRRKNRTEKKADIMVLTCLRLTSPVNLINRIAPTAPIRAYRLENLSGGGIHGGPGQN